jgi:hypothetical protein
MRDRIDGFPEKIAQFLDSTGNEHRHYAYNCLGSHQDDYDQSNAQDPGAYPPVAIAY